MKFCALVTLIVAPLSMPAVIAAETNPVATRLTLARLHSQRIRSD